MTVENWLQAATTRLIKAGVDSPRLSAEMILARVSGMERLFWRTWPATLLQKEWQNSMDTLLARREQGEPAAYLMGVREFFGREFVVTPATLIPRPETELLVEAALHLCSTKETVRFADFGTGSGCIAITLCLERPAWYGFAVDASKEALHTAAQNARKHEAHQVTPLLADFTRPLLADRSLHLLISNPPYVSEAEYAALSHEVRDFEPKSALVPTMNDHADGLEHAAKIIEAGAKALRPGGVLLIEHGCTQGAALRVLLENNTWLNPMNHKDLAGLDRFVSAVRAD